MKICPYCGYSNYDRAAACRKCDASLVAAPGTVYHKVREPWITPARAKVIRGRALAILVLGLLMKVYWGGYGPWPTIDVPAFAVTLRAIAEPLLIYGGAALYLFGLIAARL